MRETLINSLQKISISIKPAFKKVSSDNFINNVLTSDLRVSVEICPNRGLNEDLLCSIPFSFCSVTWRTPSNQQLENVEQIPALILAKQLNSNGYNVLLHLAGRNLKRDQVVRILEDVKSAGIKNLFALQGGNTRCRFYHNPSILRLSKVFNFFSTVPLDGHKCSDYSGRIYYKFPEDPHCHVKILWSSNSQKYS
ncbi:unnamed protein product [Diabrotica balteata]|uniref:Methylenetetrahydrofolate reductase (NAD(P)H) n=1 Tax=Diabrotica balteata TaxID=107213 RepID=A0A9N9XE35_DIABA|nr:unnamed protein product [Diabrotica balteata]